MLVNPGFGGQKTIPSQIKKVKNVSKMIEKSKKKIYLGVDGGVNAKNVKVLMKAGSNLVVAGNSIFKEGPKHYFKNIEKLKVIQDKK